ncbi:MAG: response regulator [Calditrichaeota bacterium]|nr:MAG: response regulator [Calditrichota bacterium]
MDNPNILIVESDPKNLQILKESFESAGFLVDIASDGQEALKLIQTQKPDIVLTEVDLPKLDGFQLLKKIQENLIGVNIPLIFLTNRRDISDKLESLRSGVKDYMIKPLHVKEIIARVNMVLRRLNKVKQAEIDAAKKMVGRLEEQNVMDLVESFGVKRQSGVLTVYDEFNRSGEIYFRDGAVVNASLGNLKGENAVYEMMTWRNGHFIMNFKDIATEDTIAVSNLGLLLEGYKRRQEVERLKSQLPPLNSVLVKTPIFNKILQKRPISSDARMFISLFDGKRTLAQIIADSHYDHLKTLERTVKLYNQGFIKPVETVEPVKEEVQASSIHELTEKREVPPVEKEPQWSAEEEQELPQESTIIQHESEPVEDKNSESIPIESNNGEQTDLMEDRNKTLEVAYEDNHLDKIPTEEVVNQNDNTNNNSLEQQDTEEITRSIEESSENNGKESLNEIQQEETESKDEDLVTEKSTESAPELAVAEEKYEKLPDASELDMVFHALFAESNYPTNHLVIISPEAKIRKEIIATLSSESFNPKSINITFDKLIEVVKIQTYSQMNIKILGISVEKKYLKVLEEIKDSLGGLLFIINDSETSNLNYLAYVIHQIKKIITAPILIAINRTDERKKLSLDFFRNLLKLDNNQVLVECNSKDSQTFITLLKELLSPEQRLKLSQDSEKANIGSN